MTEPAARFPPGHRVRVRFTKWGGRRHHGADLVYLGADEHGDWLGDPVGNHECARVVDEIRSGAAPFSMPTAERWRTGLQQLLRA